jgi:hypothetical protein
MSNDGPPPETAEALLARLRQLDSEGRIAIAIEPRRLYHIDSPVASEVDANLWVYGLILLAALAWWWRGFALALPVALVGIALYLTLGRALMYRRIARRVREKGLANLETWRTLWRFKGLTLRAKDRPGLADCASPDGNWMAFVRAFN